MSFVKSAVMPESRSEAAYYFIFSRNDILVAENFPDSPAIPRISETAAADMGLEGVRFLGQYGSTDCWCARIGPAALPAKHRLISLRALYGKVDADFWSISGYARQIQDWNLNFQFCGRCGHATQAAAKEHSRVCPLCGLTFYPRISPAIITAVVKEDQILLARGVNFPIKEMFSVLAGFVEPGESLEDCVRREILEESGIRVKQIRYFKSQSWPFPDSLMIGFTAEYAGGSLSIDRTELLEAHWFTRDNLPRVPGKPSLAGELIDWFVHGQN
jgi:NAD+ diphosphatase